MPRDSRDMGTQLRSLPAFACLAGLLVGCDPTGGLAFPTDGSIAVDSAVVADGGGPGRSADGSPATADGSPATPDARAPAPDGSLSDASPALPDASPALPDAAVDFPDARPGRGDVWSAVALAGAPSPRTRHIALWTGSEMLVWGGYTRQGPAVDGGRYDPVADQWRPISRIGAPSPRYDFSAVWTGEEMIIFGGRDVDSNPLGDGARYNPTTDRWLPTTRAPAPRFAHSAVWSGNEMIVFGGEGVWDRTNCDSDLNDVWRWRPGGTWTRGTDAGAPPARKRHLAVWATDTMIVLGGWARTPYPLGCAGQSFFSGGVYDPARNQWMPTTANNPGLPNFTSGAWTGSELIVFGLFGSAGSGYDSSLYRYSPIADQWVEGSVVSGPDDRQLHTTIWTGREAIVWGGESDANGAVFNSGARYDPEANVWTTMSRLDTPVPRRNHSAVWTGSEMIVWGGDSGPNNTSLFNDGGRYRP